jgi:hypothetical protein
MNRPRPRPGQSAAAVITGDVINSSKLSPGEWEKLHAVMNETSRQLRALFRNVVPLDVDIFRGDSWQMLVLDPPQSLRISLLYRGLVRAKMDLPGVDMRMAIAVGKIDSFPKTRVSHGRGEAFQLSGQALDSLHRAKCGNMSFIGGRVDEAAALDTVVQLIDAIAGRWTVKQALAVSGALKGMRQEEIADKSWHKKITQQAVAQHLRRAGWYAVRNGIEFFERSMSAGKFSSARS